MAFLNETGLGQVWNKIKTKINLIESTISDIDKAKVDKVSGKGLSTNDYTTAEKEKLAGIATGATKVIVDNALSSTSENAIQNKVVANMKTNIDDSLGETIKELSISGKTITYTKGDGTTGTITTQDTNTTYSAGTGLSLDGTKFSVKTGYTTSDKNYKVQADSNGNLYVNVPWTYTDTKVTQTAIVASSYTNWRPLILGASNGGTEGFTPDTKTDEVFAVQTLSCQPSSGTVKANIFKGNLNGNANTANKLATARKLTIGSTGKDFDGSAALSWSIDDIGAYALKDRGTLIPENSDLNNYTTAGNY